MIDPYKYIRYLLKRKLYYKIRNSHLVWFYFLNKKGRKLFRNAMPNFNNAQKRIVEDLKRDGIALTSIDELFPGSDLLLNLNEYARPLAQRADIKNKKTFLKYLFEVSPLLDFSNPYFKFALDNMILEIITSYLRIFPKFRGLTLNITTPVSESDAPRDSQNWHRDPEDKVVVKMFLYLNDVDEDAGPFIYVKGSHHLGKYQKLFPTDPPAGSYPSTEEVSKKIKGPDIQINTGKAGTIIFCETTGLHKGGFAKKKERLMFTSIYSTEAATSPIAYTKLKESVALNNLSLLASWALRN